MQPEINLSADEQCLLLRKVIVVASLKGAGVAFYYSNVVGFAGSRSVFWLRREALLVFLSASADAIFAPPKLRA